MYIVYMYLLLSQLAGLHCTCSDVCGWRVYRQNGNRHKINASNGIFAELNLYLLIKADMCAATGGEMNTYTPRREDECITILAKWLWEMASDEVMAYMYLFLWRRFVSAYQAPLEIAEF